MKTNNYCVWAFIHGTSQPSVFRYNYTEDQGKSVSENMGFEYYCTEQKDGLYGESLGPKNEDVLLMAKKK